MTHTEQETRIHSAGARAMVAEAARIRAELCAQRGLPMSQGCRSCEHCRPPVVACECDGAEDNEGGID